MTPRCFRLAFVGGLVALLAACAMKPVDAPIAQPTLSQAQIAQVVASPDRAAADRANDPRRKPEQLLSFIGIRPGMVALDVSTGGGYTTELLARAIGPTGKVYAQYQPRDPARPPPAPAMTESGAAPPPPEPAASAAMPRRTPADMLAAREQHLHDANAPAAPIYPVAQRFDNPVPPELARNQFDLVTLILNYHDLGFMGTDRAQMNSAIFAALKPGGLYVIADNAGRPGTGISESGTLHRIEESFLVAEVEAAGFKRVSEAGFLHNPDDPRDRNVPEPPQAKDQFVLKFVKP